MTVQVPRLRSLSTLLASYFMFGLYWGVWVVVFADFLAEHDLSEGQAGLLLAALSICSILTMTLVSPRLQRLGPARTVPLGHLAMGLGAVLLAAAPGRLTVLGFVVIGVGNGLLDVFVNVAGQMVETREHRPVLQFVHAAYNVGGIAGALGAGIALVAGAPFQVPLALTAAAFGAEHASTDPALRRSNHADFQANAAMAPIANDKPMTKVPAAGHEVEFHAWDHRGWQDRLPRRNPAWIRDWFDRGLASSN